MGRSRVESGKSTKPAGYRCHALGDQMGQGRNPNSKHPRENLARDMGQGRGPKAGARKSLGSSMGQGK